MNPKNSTTISRVTLASRAISAMTALLLIGVVSISASGNDRRLHMEKECPEYTGQAGSFCTITASNVGRIKVGSKIFYDQAAGIPAGLLDSNVVLDAGDGDRAFGRCTLDFATHAGLCTFSDGTGRLAGFTARIEVASAGAYYNLDGSYSFSQRD